MILVLEKIDLKQSLKKDAYNEKMSYFETRLGELQRACRAAGIPVIILIWKAGVGHSAASLSPYDAADGCPRVQSLFGFQNGG